MQIGPFSITRDKPQHFEAETVPPPAGELFSEISKADSSLYEDYFLRPYNPDKLYQKRGNYDLFDEMRQDEQISALLSLKKLMILDSEWMIEVDGGSDELNEEVKEFITNNLEMGMNEIFERKLFNMLSAIDYGFSITERIFEESEGKIKLKDLKTRAPHAFEFDQDNHGNVIDIRQDTSSEGTKGSANWIHLDNEKVIHYIYQGEFQNPYGKSELDMGVYRAWWSKSAIIKFWNIFLERFGMPTVVGKYPAAMTQHKSILQKVLKNIQSKTSITVPAEMEIDLLERASGGSGTTDFEAAINHYNMSIARKMLIPDLLGYSGTETSGGSYALGESQFGLFYTIIEQLRKELQSVVNKSIVKPLAFWNYGSAVDAEFKFHKVDEFKKERDLKLWIEVVNSGKVPITDTHVNWFLNQIEAPEIEQDELDEINAKKEEMALAIQGPADDDKPEDVPDEKAEPKTEDKPAASASANNDKGKEFVKDRFRDLISFEAKVDFQAVNDVYDDLEIKYTDTLQDAFLVVINGLIDDIQRKKIVEKKRFDLVNKLQLRNFGRVEKLLGDMLKESYGEGLASTGRTEFASDDVSSLDNEDVVDWLEAKKLSITSIEKQKILDIVKQDLINGIRAGASVKEMQEMINDSLKPWGIKFNDPNRIETIVRTNVSDAFNGARLQQFEKVKSQIMAYSYSAILDGRTSDVCLSLDSGSTGNIYTPAQAEAINPPNHFNCRSLLVPIFKDEKDEAEKFNLTGSIPGNLEKDKGGFFKIKKPKKVK